MSQIVGLVFHHV